MNYLEGRYSREKTRQRRHRILGFVLSLVVLFVFGSGISRGLQEIGASVWTFFDTIETGMADSSLMLESKEVLAGRVQTLEEVVRRDQGAQERLSGLEVELGRMDYIGNTASIMPARVLVRPPDTLYDRVVINQGLRDGISEGMQVYASDNVLVGIVEETLNDISFVSLFTTAGNTVEGVLYDAYVPVELTGAGGGMYKIALDRQVPVEIGDIVSSPDGSLPVLGVVRDITFDPQDPVKNVLVRSPVNVYELLIVGVQ